MTPLNWELAHFVVGWGGVASRASRGSLSRVAGSALLDRGGRREAGEELLVVCTGAGGRGQ